MGVDYREIRKSDLEEAQLPNLNEFLREIVDEINRLGGLHGPIVLQNDLDLDGNRIRQLGSPEEEGDALSRKEGDAIFGGDKILRALEATGDKILQTARRLNDRRQRERHSSWLDDLGSTPPATNNSTVTVVDNMNGTTTVTVSAGTVTFADGSTQDYSQRQDTFTDPGSGSEFYYYYLQLSDDTLQFAGPFTQNTSENRHNASLDGRVFIATAQVDAAGGGGGGGGGEPPPPGFPGGCCEVGTPLVVPSGSELLIEVKSCGEWVEIEIETGRKLAVAIGTLVSTFVGAQDLQPGDLVEISGGEFEPVKSVGIVRRASHKMVVKVSPGKTYYGHGMRLHNDKPPPPG